MYYTTARGAATNGKEHTIMKKFEKRIDNRKLLVARLSELTGLNARYTFVPRCAYEIGAFVVEKDGSLTVGDEADERILETLISENMIGEERHVEEPSRTQKAKKASANTPTPVITPIVGTEDWEDEEWGDDDEESNPAVEEEQEIWQPDTDIFAETETPAEVTESGEPSTQNETASVAPENEAAQEVTEDSAARLSVRDNYAPLEAAISFPLSKHTSTSVINLICMIHSRGYLLSKATGGTFYAEKALVNDLLDHPAFLHAGDVLNYLRSRDAFKRLKGISFDDEKITLDGFGEVKDAEHLQTYLKLAAAMNKMALTQKRVQAKDVDDANEKYALRIWLIRLGLKGNEYKADRKRLMENLSGHTAFRNEEDKARWTARQTAKRDALKAEKAASAAENVTTETL